ncbi:class I SAM-dependent methyltransferase [Nocardia sp. KC 131]|uniref:class I SAM-dependent methyltransferase n=1 Tax=Nocardia arseniciresistens TaxID=3392119 RepID=UPI00398EB270
MTGSNPEAQRLNAIAAAIGCRNYLEIGVATGDTFAVVEAPRKTGVDPAFQFDISAASTANVDFFTGTSDEFFAQLDSSVSYDLVYIDGLHTFAQTYRDFCNVLTHTHDRSVIVLDDVWPTDIFSVIPDYHRAMAERFRTGVPGMDWHGDVFKIASAIHDYHTTLSYATALGEARPAMLVWRAPRRDSPRFRGLEEIERQTYLDFLDRLDLLNAIPQADAIRLSAAPARAAGSAR